MTGFDAEELLVLSRLDLEKGAVDAGLLKLKQALGQKSCPPEAQLEAARVYAQLGLRQKAYALFKTYVEAKPEDLDARFQLGMVRFEEGALDEAVSTWDAVLKKAPNYPPALFYRAMALSQSQKRSEAVQQLKALLDVIPTDNLYFNQAKELLVSLQSAANGEEGEAKRAKAAYRTEH